MLSASRSWASVVSGKNNNYEPTIDPDMKSSSSLSDNTDDISSTTTGSHHSNIVSASVTVSAQITVKSSKYHPRGLWDVPEPTKLPRKRPATPSPSSTLSSQQAPETIVPEGENEPVEDSLEMELKEYELTWGTERAIVRRFIDALRHQELPVISRLICLVEFSHYEHSGIDELDVLKAIGDVIRTDNVECFAVIWEAVHADNLRLQLSDTSISSASSVCPFETHKETAALGFNIDDWFVLRAYNALTHKSSDDLDTTDRAGRFVRFQDELVKTSDILEFLQDRQRQCSLHLWLVTLRLAESIPLDKATIDCILEDIKSKRWTTYYGSYSHLSMIDAVLFHKVHILETFVRLYEADYTLLGYTRESESKCLVPGAEAFWSHVQESLSSEQLCILQHCDTLTRLKVPWCQGLAQVAIVWWMFQPRSALETPLFHTDLSHTILKHCLNKSAALEAGDFVLPKLIHKACNPSSPRSSLLGSYAFEVCTSAMNQRFAMLRTLCEPGWFVYSHPFKRWSEYVDQQRRMFSLESIQPLASASEIEPRWGESDDEEW